MKSTSAQSRYDRIEVFHSPVKAKQVSLNISFTTFKNEQQATRKSLLQLFVIVDISNDDFDTFALELVNDALFRFGCRRRSEDGYFLERLARIGDSGSYVFANSACSTYDEDLTRHDGELVQIEAKESWISGGDLQDGRAERPKA